jgi:putative ABC transport system permease protein
MAYSFWRTAVRLAWRDLRYSPARSAMIAVAMVVSIAGIGGVDGAANTARHALRGDSRAWLGGDIGLDTRDPVDVDQTAALDRARDLGIQWTGVSTALTMASSDAAPDPAFIALKAVDPSLYPFYGAITLAPTRMAAPTLKSVLDDDTAAVSSEVLERLNVKVGDSIQIAGKPFRIAGLIQAEPDRFSGNLGIGLRCIISREAYRRTDVEESGNSVKTRILLRLPPGSDLDQARRFLESIFPDGSVRDYRDAYQKQTESAISFVGVTAFLALVLGAIGVAIAVRQHVDEVMPALAIMKTLGARSTQLAALFFLQIGWLMMVALALGAPLGFTVRVSLLAMARKYLALPPVDEWNLASVLMGAGAGLAVMAPILAQPALLIRHLRPAVVLRRDVPRSEILPAVRTRSGRRSHSTWIAAFLAFGALLAVGMQMLESWRSAMLLIAALAGCAGVAWILTSVAFSGLRRCMSTDAARRIPILRHGVSNVYHAGSRSRLLIAVMATALAMMMATFETSGAVVQGVVELLPFDRDSLFVAGFKDAQGNAVREFLSQLPGVGAVEMITQVRLPLRSVDGWRTVAGMGASSHVAVCDPQLSTGGTEPAKLIMADDEARHFHVSPGSRLEFEGRDRAGRDRVFAVTLVATRKWTPAERYWSTMLLDCAGLDSSSMLHQAFVRVPVDRISSIRQMIGARYPTLAVISPDDLSETILSVSRDAMTLARLVAWFAIGAGLCVMMAMVAASRSARLREMGILTALGARRATISGMYTVEFACIGLLAGVIASLLTWGFTSVVLSVVLQHPESAAAGKTITVAVVISVALTVGAGWLPSWGLLQRRPMEVLRGD